jgi:hypothetical protein
MYSDNSEIKTDSMCMASSTRLYVMWWGRGKGLVGKMPHQSMVLKNVLMHTDMYTQKKRSDN